MLRYRLRRGTLFVSSQYSSSSSRVGPLVNAIVNDPLKKVETIASGPPAIFLINIFSSCMS